MIFFSVNCANVSNGDIEYCQCHPCGENEGDCDVDEECMGDTICGIDNCPEGLGFESNVDCCYTSQLGDERYCNYQLQS